LMVRSITASFPILLWVVALIMPILTASALGIHYMLVDYLEEDATKDNLEQRNVRLQIFQYFGTFSRSLITMFEATFASYVPMSRLLHNEAGGGFAVFFMFYKMVVGMAILRVIYGVFMHMTFQCANSDDEALMAKKQRQLKAYAAKMHCLFTEMDSSGDGFLSKEEFCNLASLPKVQTFLAAMDLEIRDAELVFDLLANKNQLISAKDMVYGFSWLKGNARSVDCVAILGLVRSCLEKLEVMDSRAFKHVSHVPASAHANPGQALLVQAVPCLLPVYVRI